MARTYSPLLPLCAAGLAFSAIAHADPQKNPSRAIDLPAGTMLGTHHVMVVTPAETFRSSPANEVSNVLYINRCVGGCQVTGGTFNDARQHIATYITVGPHTVTEFANDTGQVGAAADTEWNAIVDCLKEVYSPFNVVLTETKPTTGNYTEAIIAGNSGDVGLNNSILGVAPAHDGCLANDNAMSFTFANNPFTGSGQGRIWDVCSTAAQESAHHYGLDHEYEFADGRSACNDPMTYRTDCGGEKFFRNDAAKCGEDMVRDCYCGGLQNSHAKIKGVFGDGVTTIPPPTSSIVYPTGGATITSALVVQALAGSKRGVAKVELWLNGHKWAEAQGAGFGPNGQKNPDTYPLTAPSNVPNSIIDIVVKAYDDLGAETDSAAVTITKGAACTAASSCLAGQKCEAGKCFWDPPTGMLGDVCTYNEFCTSGSCADTSDGKFCTKDCIAGVADSCPMGFECVPTTGTNGDCLAPSGGGGCCSVGHDGPWVHGGLAGLVIGLVLRRRRRR